MAKGKSAYKFLPIYERHIFYTNCPKDVKKEILKYFNPEDVDFRYLDDDNIEGIVAPIPHPKDDECITAFVMCVTETGDSGTCAHEALHMTNRVMYYLGQDLDDLLNDEAHAYLTGYFAKTFMELIRGEEVVDRTKKKLKRGKK